MNPSEPLTEPSPELAPVDLPEPAVEREPEPVRAKPAAFAPGLVSGLSVLASVFSLVIALAGYRLKSEAPAAPEAAKPTPAAVAKFAATPPTVPAIPPPLPADTGGVNPAATDAAVPPTAAPRGDVDAAIRQMNDEANDLMPNTLPLPIPPEQYQYLVDRFQKLATRYFPQLAVQGSPFNRVFVAKYTQYHAGSPNYFEQPDWPVALATECAESLFKTRTAPPETRAPAGAAPLDSPLPGDAPRTAAPVDSERQDLPQQ